MGQMDRQLDIMEWMGGEDYGCMGMGGNTRNIWKKGTMEKAYNRRWDGWEQNLIMDEG